MRSKINKKKILFQNKEWLFIIGFILAPMTGLRVWKIGPSEIMLFMWSTQVILTKKIDIRKNVQTYKFWAIWIISIILGTIIGTLKYPQNTIPQEVVTYFYLFYVVIAINENFKERSFDYIDNVLRTTFYFGSLWYGGLYFYSVYFSRSFLGAPLWYGGVRFTGGGLNPHQLALFSGFLVIYAINLLLDKKNRKLIIVNVVILSLVIMVSLQTKSSTLYAGVFVSIIVYPVMKLIASFNKLQKILVINLLGILALITIIIFGSNIMDWIMQFMNSDPNGAHRIQLWLSVLNDFWRSPLFGLGPGVHAWDPTISRFIEYHNSYIEIYVMSGFVGLANFAIYFYNSFRKISHKPWNITIIVFFLVYAFSGFVVRRLVFWITINLFVIQGEKSKRVVKYGE